MKSVARLEHRERMREGKSDGLGKLGDLHRISFFFQVHPHHSFFLQRYNAVRLDFEASV